MFVVHRLLISTILLTWIVGLELIKKTPMLWWAVLIGLILQIGLLVWFVNKKKIDRNLFHFLILPVGFAVCSYAFCLFLVNVSVFHVMVVLSAIVLYLLIKQYYIYSFFPLKYQPYSLESLSWYFSLVTYFFLFASAFGSYIVLKFNFQILSVVVVILLALLIYYYFWINKISFNKSKLFISIIVLIALELFTVVSFLPTGYYVNSFIITIALYLTLSLSKLFLVGGITRKKVMHHVIVVCVMLLAVLFTARWD
jgi:hypothetical protein